MNKLTTNPGRLCRALCAVGLLAAAGCGTAPDITAGVPGPDTAAHQYESVRSSRMAARGIVWNPSTYRMPQRENLGAPMNSSSWRPEPALGGSVSPDSQVLVLYDTGGPWGYAGELYAMATANLMSHFGGWVARPVSQYVCGEAGSYRAVAYLGSTYDEQMPTCLLDDVLASQKPVIWSYYNIWQLHARAGATGETFQQRYGFTADFIEDSNITGVRYRGEVLERKDLVGEFMKVTIHDPTRAEVLAEGTREDGTTTPWVTRSGNLYFVAENPFTYMSEESRMWVYADLLYEALAPQTPERHRAILRLEDIGAMHDPTELRAITNWLYSQHIPFGFATIAQYKDPNGVYNGGTALTRRISQSTVANELRYMQSHGGTLVMHGYTHQWTNVVNPYSAVSADDYEFYRVTENADYSLTYNGPVPGDSLSWAGGLLDRGLSELRYAGLGTATIFEFPHYAASPNSYQAVASRFPTAWDRRLYFTGQLRGGAPDYGIVFGQMFPYVVRDVHGTRVLPENLGNIEVDQFYTYPTRSPEQVARAAQLQRVVRDNVVGFYFHPFLSLSLLQETVQRIQALGYTFVSPASLE